MPDIAPDRLDDAAIERYARQLVLPNWDEGVQVKLLGAHIAIIGLGGLGMPVLSYLAGAGVGNITLIEPDTVDITNLHRQHMPTLADIGKPKLDVAAAFVRQRFPDCKLILHHTALSQETAAMQLANCSLIIDCTDSLAARHLIARQAITLGRPHIFAGAVRNEGQISVFAAGSEAYPDSPCFGCIFPEDASFEQAPSCAQAGVSGPVVGMMAALQANEALKLLTGIGTPLIGRLLLIDGLSTHSTEIRVSRRPDCALCGS